MNKIKKILGMDSVHKKILVLSKLAGAMIVLFYLFASELSPDRNFSFWVWVILLTIVILGIDFMLGRLVSRPLKIINKTAQQMAELDFSAYCDVHTDDEFGELSDSLNTMSSNLQEALIKLEQTNTQLEEDVQQEQLLHIQRKELVDSLSHEMKTPLGLIRAYTEGLKDEDDEHKKQQYMDAILLATERMDNMIISLLDLSALEAGAARLQEERFDFVELAETIAGKLLIDTPEETYQFTYQLPDHKVFVHADKKRIEQVLTNLIENAKKHVSENGEIQLTITSAEDKLYFSVFNQGDIIPEAELSKIWVKFYRGQNTTRSGSGLGLAIVAQILTMYKTLYGVNNQTDGVKFYFEFPTID